LFKDTPVFVRDASSIKGFRFRTASPISSLAVNKSLSYA
jgi:hypothetical protein